MSAVQSAGRPLAQRVAVVTGGGKGIGRAIALDLAAHGARVVVNNRNRTPLPDGRSVAEEVVDLIREQGGEAVAETSDVAEADAADRIVAAALGAWGRLDICVTSAGISGPGTLHRTPDADFDAVVVVNLLGTAHLAAACCRVMRGAGYGRVVLLASTGGLHGEPTLAAYAASKGGTIALGRTLAVEGARRGITTHVLLPYATTQMTGDAMAPGVRETMTAKRVAPVVTALVDERCTDNGLVLVAGGGGLRGTRVTEGATVRLPDGELSPEALADLVAASAAGEHHPYPTASQAFAAFAQEVCA